MEFRPFFVRLRRDLDAKQEMKPDLRARGFASFYPQAFQKKRLYPVLAVDTDRDALNGTAQGCVQRRPMLLIPNDDGFIVWVEGRYFHFAGFKDKRE